MKKIAILGSTGSIGTQALDVISKNEDMEVVALSCGKNIALLEKQIREFHPSLVSVWDEDDAKTLKDKISDLPVKVTFGMEGLLEVASMKESNYLLTAIVGMLGILPTIAGIKAKKTICLANKETLVTAGHIIMPLAKENGVDILPVDSEHSAIFQSLQGNKKNAISHIWLTASGGPFRGYSLEDLKKVTLENALKHPNWSMGKKITIDSATLANKGLEVMEAKWLFNVELDQINVLVHPQSIIHSAVEYEDGAVIAQLGTPDMRLPIQYAFTYPDRRIMNEKKLDFYELSTLTFERADEETFRALYLAKEAMRRGGNVPTVFNAANETAVAYFLKKEISFLEIPALIEECMNHISFVENPSVDEILDTQKCTDEYLHQLLSRA